MIFCVLFCMFCIRNQLFDDYVCVWSCYVVNSCYYDCCACEIKRQLDVNYHMIVSVYPYEDGLDYGFRSYLEVLKSNFIRTATFRVFLLGQVAA